MVSKFSSDVLCFSVKNYTFDIFDCSFRSPAFHNFIKTALTKNPKKRPTAEKLLAVSKDFTKENRIIITTTEN